MFDVGVVERNVGDEVQVTTSFVRVDVGLFLRSAGVGCTLGAEAPKEATGACRRSQRMLLFGDVGTNVGGFGCS